MSKLLLIVLAIWALPLMGQAQTATSLTLRNHDGSKAYTIKRGDYVKIRLKDAYEKNHYRGSFSKYKNGQVYLKGKPGIPIEQVQNISYRPLAYRILFWGMLLLGAILIDVGFLSVFVVAGNGPLNMVKAGLAIMGASVLLHIFSLKHATDIPANWNVEQWSPPAPAQEMAPMP